MGSDESYPFRRTLRRPLRNVSRGGGPAAGPPSASPSLPATAVEFWHGELGASSASAVGQLQGITLTGRNGPTVAPDPGFFNGRSVYQSTIIGARCWLGTSLATGVLSGARPWVFVVGRSRTVPSVTLQTLVDFGRAGSSDMRLQLSAANARGANSSSGHIQATNGVGDGLVHRYKMWTDESGGGGGTSYFAVDDAMVSGTTTGPLSGTITTIGLGSGAVVVQNVADASIAFVLACSADPTAAEEAALDAWAQAYWGAP